MSSVTVKMEGLKDLDRALGDMSKATSRNNVKRALTAAAEPAAEIARHIAPVAEGDLKGSITVSTQLTRRHRRGAKQNEVEVHIGPRSGKGVLNYATFAEFGTSDTLPQPFMRPMWDTQQQPILKRIKTELASEIEKTAARAARKAARLAAKG